MPDINTTLAFSTKATIDAALATEPRDWPALAQGLAALAANGDAKARDWVRLAARGHLDKKLGGDKAAFEAAIAAIEAALAPMPAVEAGDEAETAEQGRGRYARNGRRAHTLDTLTIAHDAAAFAGLPSGIRHQNALLATLKQAAKALGIPPALVTLIDRLFADTQPQDWLKTSRPIVWTSNLRLAHDLGLSVSAVKKLVRQAHLFGLVVMKDSPTGARSGRRAADGMLVIEECFGFDLSPLAVRHAELAEAAQKSRVALKDLKVHRRRATIARKATEQCLATAEAFHLWSTYWETTEASLERLGRRLAGTVELETTAGIAGELEALRADAEGILRHAQADAEARATEKSELFDLNMGPAGTVASTLTNSTNTFLERSSVLAQQECSRPSEPSSEPPTRAPAAPTPSSSLGHQAEPMPSPRAPGRRLDLTPGELGALVPVLAPNDDPSWRDLAANVEALRRAQGISHRTWAEAVADLSLPITVVLFALVVSKGEGHFTSGAGAYFAGLAAKARRGQLDFSASIRALRRRGAGAPPPASPTPVPPAPNVPAGFVDAGAPAAAILAAARAGGRP